MNLGEQSTSKNDCNKRSLDETEEPMDCSEPASKKEKISTNDASTSQSNKESDTLRLVSKDHILNFPIPNKDGKACIVKVSKKMINGLNSI